MVITDKGGRSVRLHYFSILFSFHFSYFRSTYSQELKKIKESKSSGAGTDMVYVPSVKWFSLLDESIRNINSILTESESNLVCAFLIVFIIRESFRKEPERLNIVVATLPSVLLFFSKTTQFYIFFKINS